MENFLNQTFSKLKFEILELSKINYKEKIVFKIINLYNSLKMR
ncbi:MAG: hypothetical protein BAJALOKI2v1_270021 [Promethearchaeota archaeon]|nr:MAG: hypothetical protein BAJALOKI2v1_270021 [Candidatus Lokiarchaeota archaeon]